VPTLPCKLAKHIQCNACSSVDCGTVGGFEKILFLWSGGFEKNQLFTADVQNDALLPSRMHAVMLSSD